MNMPLSQDLKVNFTTTLFALIRENLSIKIRPSKYNLFLLYNVFMLIVLNLLPYLIVIPIFVLVLYIVRLEH